MRAWRSAVSVLSLLSIAGLCGCKSLGGIGGAFAGAASGSATANPAIGVAVGVSVQAGIDETVNYVMRTLSHEEQAQIAGVIGSMKVGDRAPWVIQHRIPYGDEHGQLTVVRAFSTPLAACKEAVFSVEKDSAPATAPQFVATACEGSAGWNWAVAEPATGRWGALQ